MKALRLEKIGELKLVDIPVPSIKDDELLVKTKFSTICTSDIKDVKENPFNISLPVVIGHEGAGIVERIGKKVKGFTKGDRVAAHPVHPCHKCDNCKNGKAHLCSNMGHFGLNMQGTFAEYFAVREDRARIIPAGVELKTATLTEPVCVCLEALKQAKLKQNDTLLIIGDGPFGIITARLALSLGLSKIVVLGHHEFRLSLAKNAVLINSGKIPEYLEGCRNAVQGKGFDAVILAVGSKQGVSDGVDILKAGGRLVVFSAIAEKTPVDLFKVHVKELEIIGACNDRGLMDEAITMLSDTKLDLKSFVTQVYSIEDHKAAFSLAEKGKDSAVKVAVEF